MLEQAVTHRLADARSVLLAGCGGGYDVLGALPLYLELRAKGREVHLANLSFASLTDLTTSRHPELPNLHDVGPESATELRYCPEAWLSSWLSAREGRRVPVHCFEKTGVRPLRAAYEGLVHRFGLDAIVLIDGGIDALLRGDESSLGTPSEDLSTLAAIDDVEVPTKLLACLGLGAELRDGIRHAQVFERIGELSRAGGYLGVAALLPDTPAGFSYLEAVEFVFAHQAEHRRSHVHAVVRAAARGEAGGQGPYVWLSALSSLYWFFDARVVARTHLFLELLKPTETMFEVVARVEAARRGRPIRERSDIPL
jgi:hypothetical protein